MNHPEFNLRVLHVKPISTYHPRPLLPGPERGEKFSKRGALDVQSTSKAPLFDLWLPLPDGKGAANREIPYAHVRYFTIKPLPIRCVKCIPPSRCYNFEED